MDKELMMRLLPTILRSQGQASLSIVGVSMLPTLTQGDIVTIRPCDRYEVGDIVVYPYKNEGLLIHRLLRVDGRGFCKGDNALRLEDIPMDDILGKVILQNDRPLEAWPPWKTALSYAVNRQFVRCRYDQSAVKATAIYKVYQDLIMQSKESCLMYVKNKAMDHILSDNTSLAVFDPASGNTYFFDEIGIDILSLLEEPKTLDELLAELSTRYLATPDEMKSDVEEFLAYTVSKGIVNVL